jgi:hypothetical protein
MIFETKSIIETVREGRGQSNPDIDLSENDTEGNPRYGRARFSYDRSTGEGVILLPERLDYFNSISSCVHEYGHLYDFSISDLHTKLKPLEEVEYRSVLFTSEEIEHLRDFFNNGVDLPFQVVVDISKRILKKIVREIPDDLPIKIQQMSAREMDQITVEESKDENDDADDKSTMSFDIDDRVFKRREVVAMFLDMISIIVLENSLKDLGWLKNDVTYPNVEGPPAYRRVKNIAYGLLQRGLVPRNSNT